MTTHFGYLAANAYVCSKQMTRAIVSKYVESYFDQGGIFDADNARRAFAGYNDIELNDTGCNVAFGATMSRDGYGSMATCVDAIDWRETEKAGLK